MFMRIKRIFPSKALLEMESKALALGFFLWKWSPTLQLWKWSPKLKLWAFFGASANTQVRPYSP